MKMTTRRFFSLAIGSLVAGLVAAGSLEPPGSPAPTMVTLQQIYDAVTTTPGQAGSLEPPAGAPAPTMVTLQQISAQLRPPGQVAKTGQTECWDASGTAIACPGTGQDGEYQRGVSVGQRFTDNLNGTVNDNLTGLIWLKNANCFSYRTWVDALAVSNSLAAGNCGLSDGSVAGDWRLPNVKELHSLIDFGQAPTALPAGHPFSAVQSHIYWSSTTSALFPGDAWEVNLTLGNVNTDAKSDTIFVWPVRGGP